jgi:hypothetical protein
MRTLLIPSAALVAFATLAGCAPTSLAPPGSGPPAFPCHGSAGTECDLTVNPNGQWVPTLIEARKGSGGRYPDIVWKLDPGSPFKFIGQGIYFDGEAAQYFRCNVTGNRKHVRCRNDAPQTPESGRYRYRVQIELDPFVWNN